MIRKPKVKKKLKFTTNKIKKSTRLSTGTKRRDKIAIKGYSCRFLILYTTQRLQNLTKIQIKLTSTSGSRISIQINLVKYQTTITVKDKNITEIHEIFIHLEIVGCDILEIDIAL